MTVFIATLQALTYIEGHDQKSGPIWSNATKMKERVLNRIPLINSTAEKCALMQVINQPQLGTISTTKGTKIFNPPFR